MKMSSVCFVLGLVLLIAVSTDAEPQGIGHPAQCCFSFVTFKVPVKNIVKVEKTPDACPKEAYVITTVLDKKLCVEEFPSNYPAK